MSAHLLLKPTLDDASLLVAAGPPRASPAAHRQVKRTSTQEGNRSGPNASDWQGLAVPPEMGQHQPRHGPDAQNNATNGNEPRTGAPELTPHLGPQLTFKCLHGLSQFQAWAQEKLHLSNCRFTVISATLGTLYCLLSWKALRLEATRQPPAPIHHSFPPPRVLGGIPQTTIN